MYFDHERLGWALNLNKLEIVLLIHEFGKISSAAEHLGLKQPTVTFHMKSLEEDLGVKLFESIGGKIRLTEAGTALQHYAHKIISLTREARHAVKEFDKLGKGSIKIGASYVPGTYVLPKILGSMTQIYPQMSISLLIKTAPVIREMLNSHEIDIGVISSEFFDDPQFISEAIRSDELVLACAPDHPFATQDAVLAQEIAQEPFIYHSQQSTTRRMTQKWADEYNVTLHTKMEFESLEAIKQAVQLGEGISFISSIAIEDEVQRGILSAIPIPNHHMERSIYVLYNKDRWLTQWMREFLEKMSKPLSRPFEDARPRL